MFYITAVSELNNNRRKLVRDVACLAAEGRLTVPEDCTTISKAIFVTVSTWQWYCKFIIIIAQIVRSNHITPLNEFREQIIRCEAV